MHDGDTVERLVPPEAILSVVSKALDVLLMSPEATHCTVDDCSHAVARKVIAYLAYPTYVVHRE